MGADVEQLLSDHTQNELSLSLIFLEKLVVDDLQILSEDIVDRLVFGVASIEGCGCSDLVHTDFHILISFGIVRALYT